jgi:secreted PhoX family phosphatase
MRRGMRVGAAPDAGRDVVSRRTVLRWSGSAGVLAVAATVTQGCTTPSDPGPGVDENGVWLAPGFTSRIIARGGEPVPGVGTRYRIFPDGAATFVDPAVVGGWYLAVNHEVPGGGGGVTSLRFAPDGTVVGAQRICSNTSLNCAGGATPWGTWLTCEEWDGGVVWECDPTGVEPARRRGAMGAFAHEAAAVADDGRLYLTEDRPDGGFYRFTPVAPGDLSDGLLEIATGTAPGAVTWAEVPNPRPAFAQAACRRQVPGTMAFDGGEGVATQDGLVWFTTKGDNRVWEYDTGTANVRLRYQAGGASVLSGVDNLWIDRSSGGLLVAEDGGNLEVVLLRPDNSVEALVRLPGQDISEITGPCFSPDGQRLYFSSQRGPVGPAGLPLGITYEVRGPFDELLGRP